MESCEFVTLISILACSIAKDKSQEEIAILSAIFTQLRRYSNDNFSLRFKSIKLIHFRNIDKINYGSK